MGSEPISELMLMEKEVEREDTKREEDGDEERKKERKRECEYYIHIYDYQNKLEMNKKSHDTPLSGCNQVTHQQIKE